MSDKRDVTSAKKKPSRFLKKKVAATDSQPPAAVNAAANSASKRQKPGLTAADRIKRQKREKRDFEDEKEDDGVDYSESEEEEEEGGVDRNAEANADSDEDEEIVDIDFEFFDPRESDYPTFKKLLASLFDADAELFNLSELADMIIKQPLLGSTVKIDGIESDPFAVLTVFNMKEHKDKEVMRQMKQYLLDKLKSSDSAFHARLSKLLEGDSGSNNVGLLLTERLVNMPAQIAPPMFNMLMKEIEWAVEEKEPYNFTHYLLLSKSYRAVTSDLVEMEDEEGGGRTVAQKKKKGKGKAKANDTGEWGKDMFYFQPEHEVIDQFAEHACGFPLTHATSKTVADARRAFHEFGIVPSLKAFLIPAAKLADVVEAMEKILEG